QAGGGKSEHRRARCRVTPVARGYTRAARPRGLPTESATETQTASVSQEAPARVKRWSKSPPLQAQARRHGKPHRVQGQIGDRGAARSRFRTAERVPGTGC